MGISHVFAKARNCGAIAPSTPGSMLDSHWPSVISSGHGAAAQWVARRP